MSKSLVALVFALVLAGAGSAWAQGKSGGPDTGDCSQAAVHWASVEAIGTREAYQDHLARFPNCAFATLAKVRLSALGQGAAPAAKQPVAQGDCSQSESEWAGAESTRTRQAYEDYLARFPNCDYATLAKVRIATFGPSSAPSAPPPVAQGGCSQSETAWANAESTRTRQAYEDYLARFPTCDYAKLAKVRIAAFGPAGALSAPPVAPGDCSQAESDWTKAESAGTRQAYEDHLARYPTCGYATLAKVRIAAFGQGSSETSKPSVTPGDCSQSETEWANAESARTRQAYEDYLARFPNCGYATLAKVRIAAFGQGNAPPPQPSAPPNDGAVKTCPAGQVRDSDGDCVRDRKGERENNVRSARRSAPARTRASAESEPATSHGLNCSDPLQVMACANKALSTLPH